MQQPDIEINLDGINWARLLENSKKKLLIPSINDKKKVFTDTITETNIQNDVRKVKVENFQKVQKYESRTSAGNFSLWICSNDENS
jgi:5-formyltetrahydrofolate cyclo-ligase